MARSHRLFCCVLTAVLLSPPFAVAQAGVDLIPADAAAAIVLNSLSRVRDNAEKFIKDCDLPCPEEFSPSTYFKWVLANVKGLDEMGSAVVVIPCLKNVTPDTHHSPVGYYALPVADVDEMASNFGIKKGELKPDKIHTLDDIPVDAGPLPQFLGVKAVLLRGKHLFAAPTGDALSHIPEGKSVGGELNSQQKAALTKADLAVYVGVDALGPMYLGWLEELEKKTKPAFGTGDNSRSKPLLDALRQTRSLVGGLSLGDGGRITVVARFNKGKDGEAAKFLSSLPAGPGASDLTGLPAAAPWFAYASKGEGVSSVAVVPALVDIIVGQFSLVFDTSGVLFHPLDLFTGERSEVGWLIESAPQYKEGQELASAVETLCRELKGCRAAVYPTSDPKKFGPLAVVGILDLGDVEKHLAGWDGVVKPLNRALERGFEGGTGKPPRFTYQPRAEKLGDRRVDLVTFEMPDEAGGWDKFLTDPFGSDWNKVRLAVIGKQVAFLVGSDLDLLKQTVTNLEAGKKGLAGEKLTAGALRELSAGRTVEIHFKLGKWPDHEVSFWDIFRTRRFLPEKMPEGLTSLAVTVESDAVQVELVPDKSAIKSWFGRADDSSKGGTSEQPK